MREFQSTPPARGATPIIRWPVWAISNFNPRPPRGGRLRRGSDHHPVQYFNPRPPRGGRPGSFSAKGRIADFNPRPPRGGRRKGHRGRQAEIGISIHAPREGGDQRDIVIGTVGIISIHAPREGGDFSSTPENASPMDFNPRPPRGGRPNRQIRRVQDWIFQSTPPARGATL